MASLNPVFSGSTHLTTKYDLCIRNMCFTVASSTNGAFCRCVSSTLSQTIYDVVATTFFRILKWGRKLTPHAWYVQSTWFIMVDNDLFCYWNKSAVSICDWPFTCILYAIFWPRHECSVHLSSLNVANRNIWRVSIVTQRNSYFA